MSKKTSSSPVRRTLYSQKTKRAAGSAPCPSRKAVPLRLADLFCVLIITAVYSCFALYDLGDRQAPITSYDMMQNQSIELSFEGNAPCELWYYIAPWHSRTFHLEGKTDADTQWSPLEDITLKNVFTWQKQPLDGVSTHLRFTLTETQASLLEWVFLDKAGRILTPGFSVSCENLFDETSLFPDLSAALSLRAGLSALAEASGVSAGSNLQVFPEAGSFRNSMYFDEIYHGRTAYEFLHGLTSYENTHPPLGKILISLGISIFGMNPFGWRIIGTLLGIAMVPVLYLFAKRIWQSIPLAALAALLFAFDFMHFAQTRIATIDVYVVFFVILMYYFMYQYAALSFYDTSLKKTLLPLGTCGICMGLGIASKWTGIYAGAGLALIFFSVLYRRYREYLYAKKTPSGSTCGIPHAYILESFFPCARRTVCFCLVFFVAIPAAIYLLSYLPFRDYSGSGLLARMLRNQTTMFSYHSSLNATHDFSSPWYEWPVISRPIWFYSHVVTKTATGGLREGISSFGNPAVWWPGIPAALYMVYLWAKKKDRTAAFLLTGYLAQYLPWFFVTRITFIYHYFPSVAFVVFMIVHSMAQWQDSLDKTPSGRSGMGKKPSFYMAVFLYGFIVFCLFLLFYPVLSGQPVDASYVAGYLRWFKSWVLTAG